MPLTLLMTVIAAFFIGQAVSVSVVSFFYTLSKTIIEIVMLFLPIMIFCFLFQAISIFEKGAGRVLLFLFLGVMLSQLMALLIAYMVAFFGLPILGIHNQKNIVALLQSSKKHIEVLWNLTIACPISASTSMISAIVLGLCTTRLHQENIFKKKLIFYTQRCGNAIIWGIKKFFFPLLPVYIFGFCMKLGFEGSLNLLLKSYLKVLLLGLVFLTIYIAMLYRLTAKDWKEWKENIKTMAPALITGFSTMSSAITLPVTLQCCEKTTKDVTLTRLVIPTVANIHLLGDCFMVTLIILSLSKIFNVSYPNFWQFFQFAIGFIIARFSGTGIPGGTILVILPVVERFFDFSTEMLSLLTTIYVLQDSFGTAGNVMGNGAFVLIAKKIKDYKK